MFPTEMKYRVIERETSNRSKTGNEYALDVAMDSGGWWTIKTWEEKPNDSNVEDTLNTMRRTMELYHGAIKHDRFTMEFRHVH